MRSLICAIVPRAAFSMEDARDRRRAFSSKGSPGLPSIRARRVIWRASTCHRILQARFPSIWVRISTSFWAFPFTGRCWDTVPGRSSVPAATSPSRTRGSSSSRRSRTPFPTTMPASVLRRRMGRSFCSATCSPTLSALRQPWIWRPSTRSSTACPRRPTVSCSYRSQCARSTSAF